jgi:hypothetical protein
MARRPKAWWPLIIDATNGAIPGYGTVAADTYLSAAEFLAAVRTALGSGFVIYISNQGRVSIASSGSFTLDFSSAPPIAALLGFAAQSYASATGPSIVTGPGQLANAWYADRSIGGDPGPEFDSAAAVTVSLSGVVRTILYPDRETRTLTFAMVPSHKTKIAFEPASQSLDGRDHTNEAAERLWRYGAARFRWWPDGAVDGEYIDLALTEESAKTFKPQRHPRKNLFGWTWTCRRIVEG